MKKLLTILLVVPLAVGGFFSLDTPRASAAAPVTDPFFSSTNLLLHLNGTNGSTTFTDQMSHPVTEVRKPRFRKMLSVTSNQRGAGCLRRAVNILVATCSRK